MDDENDTLLESSPFTCSGTSVFGLRRTREPAGADRGGRVFGDAGI